MKTQLRLVGGLAAGLLLFAGLTGCSSDDDAETKTETTEAETTETTAAGSATTAKESSSTTAAGSATTTKEATTTTVKK